MSSVDPHLWALIQRYSQRYHLDPRAVAAVSIMEGGGRFGEVGDNGSSFGPWQLHVGGALPAGRGAAWANSPAGVDYALRHMAESGAAGLHGQAAISSIVRNFERPADPGAEIRGAVSHYAGLKPGHFSSSPSPGWSGSPGMAGALLSQFQPMVFHPLQVQQQPAQSPFAPMPFQTSQTPSFQPQPFQPGTAAQLQPMSQQQPALTGIPNGAQDLANQIAKFTQLRQAVGIK